MQSTNPTKSKFTETLVISLLLLVLVAYFIAQARYTNIPIFDLRFNGYAMLSLAGTIICVIFFILAIVYKIRGRAALWSVGYIGSLTMFSFAEMLQRLSATPQGALFWSQFQTIGVSFLPAMAFLFALTYVRPSSSNTVIAPFVLLGAAINAFFGSTGSLVYQLGPQAIKLFPWGYNNISGPAFILNALWIIILSSATIMLFFNFWRVTVNKLLKRQAAIYMIGFSVPFVLGVFTDGLLPALRLDSVTPPLFGFFSVFIAGSLIVGLTKYKFFEFNPTILAQNILLTMRESVVVTNNSLEIEYLNSDGEALLGGKIADISRKVFDTLLDKSEINLRDQLSSFKDNDSLILEGFTLSRPNKEKLYLRISVGKIIENDVVEGFVFAITDITELHNSYELIQKEKESVEEKVIERTKQLQQEHARLQVSIDSLVAGFFITDNNNNIININYSAKKILSGLSKSNKLQPSKNVNSEWKLEDIEDILRDRFDIKNNIQWCLEKGQPKKPEEINLGNQFIRIYLAPVVDGEAGVQVNPTLGVVVLMEDITEEKIADRSKNEFFTIASHELRTPLAIIDGNLSMINFSYKDKIEMKMQMMLESINNSNMRLIKIVNELIEVSGLERSQPQLRFSVFALDGVINQVVRSLVNDAKKKNIYLNVEYGISKLPQVNGNPDSVSKVLTNLTSNAISATKSGGVTIGADVEKGNSVRVFVKDTGSGISPENQLLLFRKFQQAGDSLLVRSDGVGLGLYSSRLLMKNMGGDIKLENSEIGVGSVFSFNISLASVSKN